MDDIPESVSDQERWIVHHGASVTKLQTSYKMTGADTADYYVELATDDGKSVKWLTSTFSKLAQLGNVNGPLVTPKYGLREKVKAREKYEKANATDLAEFKRLKAKFDPT